MSSFCMGCGNSLSKDERYCGICGRDSSIPEGIAPAGPRRMFGYLSELLRGP